MGTSKLISNRNRNRYEAKQSRKRNQNKKVHPRTYDFEHCFSYKSHDTHDNQGNDHAIEYFRRT